MLKAMIIDDEPLSHQVLLHHLSAHPKIKVVEQCYNATSALSYLANNTVDLLFLDINMPQLTGIEMLKVLVYRPQVIIISAYQEYAIEGFELDVTDYLLKPVSAERFAVAIDKVFTRIGKQIPANTISPFITLKVDREKRKCQLSEISLIEAYGNYIKVWINEEILLANSTLKDILVQLPEQAFTKVNKSFVVNNKHVVSTGTNELMLSNGRSVRIGTPYKKIARQIM
jgi:DNA-binding LytR/AlgR family response regulator